jgi:hypothetical protein
LEGKGSVPKQTMQVTLAHFHCSYEIIDEDILPLNKFKEALHDFHQQKNTSKFKQQIYIK